MKINKIVVGSRVLAENVKVCESVASRIRGLMFSKRLMDNQALVIVNENEGIPEARLHMLFVFYKIDILWLNKKLEVVDLKQKAMPFTPLLTPRKPAKYVVEMPAGKIKENRIEIGDDIKFL